MNSPSNNGATETVRAWLENERRLGSTHIGHPPVAATAAALSAFGSAPPRRPDPPEPVRSTNPRQPVTTLVPLPISEAGFPPICTTELSVTDAAAELQRLNVESVVNCTRCGLHTGRTQTVFGVGHARPRLVFVGEGPGADEDREGEPFVGKAGQLLNKMIAAMTLRREDVFICNVVKCRPPGNRTPTPDEARACAPMLIRQLAILRPQVIVALGAPASQNLLATTTPIGRLRGSFHEFPPPPLAHFPLARCKLMPTFHPAYLLRCPWEKSKAWDDLKLVMVELGIAVPGRG